MKSTLNHPTIHLKEEELAQAGRSCPACASAAPRSRSGRLQRNPDVWLLYCPRCGATSASRMPRPDVLEEYYRCHYPEGKPEHSMPEVDRFVNRLLRAMASSGEELRPIPAFSERIRILDFGGGDGSMGLALSRRLLAAGRAGKVEFTLVDYRKPATPGDDRLAVSHRKALGERDEPFDIVLASAILEHIPELHPVMQRLFRQLAPGGVFYARTPWIVPLRRLIPNMDFTYPGHVHDLGARFWNRIPAIFGQPLEIMISRPSMVETHASHRPDRAISAWLMKLPARVELAFQRTPQAPCWPFVGGWEVVFRRRAASYVVGPHPDRSWSTTGETFDSVCSTLSAGSCGVHRAA